MRAGSRVINLSLNGKPSINHATRRLRANLYRACLTLFFFIHLPKSQPPQNTLVSITLGGLLSALPPDYPSFFLILPPFSRNHFFCVHLTDFSFFFISFINLYFSLFFFIFSIVFPSIFFACFSYILLNTFFFPSFFLSLLIYSFIYLFRKLGFSSLFQLYSWVKIQNFTTGWPLSCKGFDFSPSVLVNSEFCGDIQA